MRSFEIISIAGIIAAGTAGWVLSGSPKMVGGILSGGLIGLGNFVWLGKIVKGALTEGEAVRYTVRYLVKFLVVVIASALLIFSKIIEPLGFIIGFTITVVMVSLTGTGLTKRS